ncbi:hypothetical protein [Paractinoplanes atraurantiacus]|uniref:hypothetical protein n=1 Tax=Paractinoplanes atraurantiacus TaxID=1036182 RepID=UPI000BE3E68F|nr:hypothetical protein [Actinoplanes atraurantiacus]
MRYATTTGNLRLTVLVDGAEKHSVNLPNRGAATNGADVTLPVTGDVVWIDYITPGQKSRA